MVGEAAGRVETSCCMSSNHKTYHRGYVADMFYQVPQKPPTMDLPVVFRDVPFDLDQA